MVTKSKDFLLLMLSTFLIGQNPTAQLSNQENKREVYSQEVSLKRKVNGDFLYEEFLELQEPPKPIEGDLEKKIEEVILLSAVDNNTPSNKPKFAVKGEEEVFIYPVIKIKNGRKTEYYSSVPRIKIKGRKIKTNPSPEIRKQLEELVFEWHKIEPEISIIDPYGNSSKRTRKWIGWDKINYNNFPHKKTKGLAPLTADVKPVKLKNYAGLGTMRFSVRTSTKNKTLKTADEHDLVKGGISEKVLRVSYIKDKTFRGWLTSYFNVPGVYGSATMGSRRDKTHQTELYQGFDCADLIVGAERHINSKHKYSYADNIRRQTQFSKEYLLHWNGVITNKKGKPVILRYGKDVREGDLMFFANKGKSRFWHVVVLYKDLSKELKDDVSSIFENDIKGDGILNAQDLILHYKYAGINVENLDYIYPDPRSQRVVFGRFKR